ncbi:MAG: S49 family peptidase [Acidobacteriota bacterium]
MAGRSKGLLVVLGLFAALAVGLAGTVLVVRSFLGHVPGKGILTIEIAGPIVERAPEGPFAEVLGGRVVSLVDVRDGLVRAASDRRIEAVRLRVSEFDAGLATVQEIRRLLERVAEAGKDTAAYLETAGEFAPGNLQYLLAAGCRRVVLNPLGDVNLTGLAIRTPFVRGTLDKLGIEPEFPGIGDYKTARFFYTEKQFTPAHRDMMAWLAASLSDQVVEGIATSRGIAPERVRELVASGPFLGSEAKANGLVDELMDWQAFVDEVKADGGSRSEVSLRHYLNSGRPDRSGAPIAVLVAEGGIQRGESGYSPVPLFGGGVMGSDTIARAWRDIRRSDAKAVVFRINSPGGSAVASEVIRAEMARTAERIPVVVSMGEVAASGGYWITCGAQRILADPGTLTASIGVFGGHLAMNRFWEEKVGVTWGRLETAPNADTFGSLDPWTPEQRQSAQKFLDRIYAAFVERVSDSRKMSAPEVDAVGRGRVFTGAQAVEKRLVDGVGGFDEALVAARELAGLDADAPVELLFYPRPRPFWRQLMDRGARADLTAADAARLALDPDPFLTGPVWLPPIQVR